MRYSIVLVNAGVEEWELFTEPAIMSLNINTQYHQLIVVDNGGKERGHVNIPTMVPYATAVNLGAKKATNEQLIILNNDIKAGSNFLPIGAKPIPYGGPMILKKEGITYVEGWCIFIERTLWTYLGGFDESYKNSWEDVDLAWRLSRIGVRPTRTHTRINHVWGATRSRHPGSNKWDTENRNRLLSRIRGEIRYGTES